MDFFLARLPLFRRLPEPALERLSQALRLRRYAKGEAVFEEGGPPDSVYLLRSGLVKALKRSRRGGPVIMQVVVPGTLFGMIAVMDRRAYPVSALALRESEAYRIGTADFDDLLKRHPDFAQETFAEVGRHLRHSQALRALAKEPVEKRVMYVLWMLSESVGRELPVLREDIAEMVGSTAETAIRVLVALRKRKLIDSRWKSITVLAPQRLKALSEPD